MSDAVIKVMINPAPPPVPVVAAVAPMSMDPNLPPPEVGVYWKDGSSFVLIQGRALDQTKVGGKAGSYFTDGMRNQHWDAYVDGPHSSNIVKEHRPTFYLYVPDGSDALDYVLIVLNKKSNRREFQIGSFGGVTGGKSGVKKDKVVDFSAVHVGIRTYTADAGAGPETRRVRVLHGDGHVGDDVRRTGREPVGRRGGRPALRFQHSGVVTGAATP